MSTDQSFPLTGVEVIDRIRQLATATDKILTAQEQEIEKLRELCERIRESKPPKRWWHPW